MREPYRIGSPKQTPRGPHNLLYCGSTPPPPPHSPFRLPKNCPHSPFNHRKRGQAIHTLIYYLLLDPSRSTLYVRVG